MGQCNGQKRRQTDHAQVDKKRETREDGGACSKATAAETRQDRVAIERVKIDARERAGDWWKDMCDVETLKKGNNSDYLTTSMRGTCMDRKQYKCSLWLSNRERHLDAV